MFEFVKTHRLKILAAIGLCFVGIGYFQNNPSIEGFGSGLFIVAIILMIRNYFIKKDEPSSERID